MMPRWCPASLATVLLVSLSVVFLADVAAFQPAHPALALSPSPSALVSKRPTGHVGDCTLPLRSGAARTVRQLITQQEVAAGSSDFEGSFSAGKVRIVGAVVERDGKFLMVERLKRSRGFFEFPGGKVEEGESDADALVRELKEELDVEGQVVSTGALSEGEDGPVQLVCYRAEIRGDPRPTPELSIRWVERGALSGLAVPPADAAIIAALLRND
mmetsp:Transcript_24290/g.57707  ORF Transcript_24290/g.57707 Transcript_24290/m.57707 type:complete len:215 (-) Transcript_24290:48-692(-)